MTDVLKTKSRGYWFQRMVQITVGAPIKVPFFALPDMPFLLRRIRVVQADVEYAGTPAQFHIYDDGIGDFILATATVPGLQFNANASIEIRNAGANTMIVDANGNIFLEISLETATYAEIMGITPTGPGAGIWTLTQHGNWSLGPPFPEVTQLIKNMPGFVAGSAAGTSFSGAIPRIKASLYIASGNVKVWPEAPVDALLSNLRQTAGGIQRIFQPQPADMQNYGVGWQGSAPGDNYPVNYKYAANAQILVELTGQAVVPALVGATGATDTGMRPDYVEITLEGYNIDEGAAA